MLYLVIEKFRTKGAVAVYRRAREQGRGIPDGLAYAGSWVDLDFTRCWQLMKTDDLSLLEQWTQSWSDLVEFEIVPVRTSEEAQAVIAPRL